MMRVGVLFSGYSSVEVCPTAKGVALDACRKGAHVDILVDHLWLDAKFILEGITIVRLLPRILTILNRYASRILGPLYGRVWLPVARGIEARIALLLLRPRIGDYDYIFSVEIDALDLLDRAGYDLRRVVHLSLESVESLARYKLKRVQNLLGRVACCVIQSRERARDYVKYVGKPLVCEYVPVAVMPKRYAEHSITSMSERLRLVHSGYFAEWANLIEFVGAYQKINNAAGCELVLQGHSLGTESYKDSIRKMLRGDESIVIDEAYYDDDDHFKFLQNFNIGVALYSNRCGNENWENLIFSSGKIASYLWAGLAVITNVKHELTLKKPFLFVDDITPQTLHHAIERYLDDSESYHRAAADIARKYYNISTYLDTVWKRLAAE